MASKSKDQWDVAGIKYAVGDVDVKRENPRGENMSMRIRIVVLVGLALLMGRSAFAQEYDKTEISGNYSYASGNPANTLHRFALNGGGGAIVYNFNRFFGIKGDLQGYGASTSTFTALTVNPLIAGATIVPSVSASGNLFTYLGGAQLRLPTHTFKPFGEILIGGAHTNLYRNLNSVLGVISTGTSNNSFAFAVGGGFDIRLNKHLAIRPFQMDYLSTSFKDNLVLAGNTHQNNWRYLAGLNLTFGE
jgi:opacity protein-like surface antigen